MGRRERPLASGPLHDFAHDLRELRAATGLTYRGLEREARYSASTLSAAASGDSLPTLKVLLAYVRACGGNTDAWAERWQGLAAVLRLTNPGLVPDMESELGRPAEPAAGQPAGQLPGDHPAVSSGLPGQEQAGEPDEPPAQPAPGGLSPSWSVDGFAPLAGTDPPQIGPVMLAARLGAGAMGQVYLGHAAAGGLVAVKMIRADLADDATFRRRFRRELRALGEIRTPYTAPLVAGDADAARPWLATAYAPAVSLDEAVSTAGPLPPGVVCELAGALVLALDAIHATGLVHRDLKPSNILLTADSVQIIDFGVARAAEGTHLTATGAHVGSAAFMAPEQASGAPAGPPADVFALGSLLAYALTGKAPFGEGRTEAVVYRIVHEAPDLTALDTLTSGDNNDLDNLRDLIRACLDKNPAHRPTPASIPGRYPAAARPPGPGWLPAPVTGRITRRAAAAAALPSLPPDRQSSRRGWKSSRDRRKAAHTVRFGLAPLILAGAILVTFTILHNTGSNQGSGLTPATTAPSVSQPTSDTTPGKSHPPPTPAASAESQAPNSPTHPPPRPAAPAPQPAPQPATLLGAPDFNGYCQATGQGPVQLISADYAYGWRCSADNGIGDDAEAVCEWTDQLPASQVTNRVQDFYDPHSWQCWRITSQLGPPDWNGYCQATGHGAASLTSNNAYGWHCADGSGIDANAACEWTNGTSVMISRFQSFYDPRSWQCWR
jgi:serine/threonine protein kinase/transcriptional regulator with XRE-family HTH domain